MESVENAMMDPFETALHRGRSRIGKPAQDESALRPDVGRIVGLPRYDPHWTGPDGQNRALFLLAASKIPAQDLFWVDVETGLLTLRAGIAPTTLAALLGVPVEHANAEIGTDLICTLIRDEIDRVLSEIFPQIPRSCLELHPASAPANCQLSLRFTEDGFTHDMPLWIPEEELPEAEKIWSLVAPVRDECAIPFVASLDLARCPVTLRDLNRAKPGDMIVIGAAPAPKTPYFNMRGRLWAPLKQDDTCYTLQDSPRPFPQTQSTEVGPMEDFDETHETGPTPESIEELPVMVEFSLGDIDVPVGELNNLVAGYTFDFKQDPSRAVRIRVNGRIIGFGEIVTIGDNCGVRITERC